MRLMVRDLVLIFVAGLAEAFLLWALWNFLRASRRRPARGGSWRLNVGQTMRRDARPLQGISRRSLFQNLREQWKVEINPHSADLGALIPTFLSPARRQHLPPALPSRE